LTFNAINTDIKIKGMLRARGLKALKE